MKIITLLLSICLSFQCAFADTSQLESLIDDYQYFTTVEWNQKDKEAFAKKSAEFEQKMGDMITSEGISKEDYFKLLRKKIDNKEALRRLESRLSLMSARLSSEEITEISQEFRKDLYSRGASWLDRDVLQLTLVVGLLLLATIGMAYWLESMAESRPTYCQLYADSELCENGEWRDYSKYVCTENREEWKCTSTTTTDYLGNPRTETTCGWETVCARGYWKD